ncbi:hypothetical protein PYW08_007982 [Mythimna loreyi]|uniref:Uncharacterized protein n=1 Tax=Mythimna loreyi TaxID=667449 RepID=A0ACC2QCT2_9NEOP|nr:hypothetical protein PYW08_007982 [Mythimna loreyi]
MGAEQSNERRSYNAVPPPQMSEAQVQRLLEIQRQQYEKKLEQMDAKRTREEAAKAAELKRQEEAKAAEQRRQEAAQAALRRQQEEAVAAAQRRQQEEAAKAAAFSMERERIPYNLSGNQLQQTAAVPVYLYPNLNQAQVNINQGQHQHAIPNIGPFNNNPFKYRNPNETFENLMKTYNQGTYQPAPSAPPPPRGPTPRPRSVSRPRNAPKERDVLDCPTCQARYGMRIFQCDNGHSSCEDCKNRRRLCGICKKPLTNRRNYDIENHISQTKAPCPHKSEGCKLYIKMIDMESHVKECPFKEQNCPLTEVFGTCHWKGKLSEISSHFDSMHANGCQTKVDSEMQLTNIRNNSQQVHLTVLGVYNFLLHLKVSENEGKVYMAVQLIGTKFSAQKWLYEIHVYNKSENRRKYVFTDSCCSSHDKIEDVFNAGECAVLPVWYANTFVCNGALTYKFFIKKSDEEKKGGYNKNRGRGRETGCF